LTSSHLIAIDGERPVADRRRRLGRELGGGGGGGAALGGGGGGAREEQVDAGRPREPIGRVLFELAAGPTRVEQIGFVLEERERKTTTTTTTTAMRV